MAKYKQECIFGLRAVIEAIQQEKEIDKVMFKKGLREGELFQKLFIMVRDKGIPFQYVPEEVFKPFEGRNHQGVLAEVSPITYRDIDEVVDRVLAAGEMPLILILDRITDVRNLGGIARTAECAGVHALVIPTKNSAKISSDAIKTSAGALYHLPVCREQNLKKVIKELKRRGMMVYAASEKGEKYYTEVDMKEGCVIIMGSEDTGIDEELLRHAHEQIKIPQKGDIESLNVSAAAAVVLYEAVRQRG
ncbi:MULTISPECIES: 23S rRNA (guanosine(2251)-2'-O)-methyltransferase RlmB [Porphyromonadaceae]|uniref:RNA methyltransferase n=1 Tax=Sanguibacteroides justesenii TaxID=1547597 RepID=A0A0C3RK59_9PORP|nr:MULTISPECIES: 23S rRNA (guanosine(2251)-2'-O)-methyltransferase RlmB [Porphyromonadaceae]KIO46769.1 RNA methyltransferase [Sanguibacteroides justesenii]KIO46845.1 RNA methyltransferase [Sanguibacteroides justesenii]MCR9012979.1 23S rRNA (guanosine(2251)-2'-O)-methyltransferase RlmB [Gabonibacter chumensis]PXZ43472.1 23S rRNA (guanosine(2251)-2'-O)-methyltransferase RlmB [Sanguibacteroides justesenii]